MSLILAIEPDRRQAAQLTGVIRQRVGAQLVLADTTEGALDAIGNRVPDLVLVPALLSPQDDAALAAALRVIAAAAHVRTLTTPVLASTTKGLSQGGVLAKWRRSRAKSAAPDGCDPAVFAEQMTAYLKEAAAERAALEAAWNLPPDVEEPAHDAVQPAPAEPIEVEPPIGTLAVDVGPPIGMLAVEVEPTSATLAVDVEPASETPAVEVEAASETLAVDVEPAVATPAIDIELASETPAVEVEAAIATPAIDIELASETPAIDIELASETLAVDVEPAVETPALEVEWAIASLAGDDASVVIAPVPIEQPSVVVAVDEDGAPAFEVATEISASSEDVIDLSDLSRQPLDLFNQSALKDLFDDGSGETDAIASAPKEPAMEVFDLLPAALEGPEGYEAVVAVPASERVIDEPVVAAANEPSVEGVDPPLAVVAAEADAAPELPKAPPVEGLPDRPPWVELIESLRHDIERLRAERLQSPPVVVSKTPDEVRAPAPAQAVAATPPLPSFGAAQGETAVRKPRRRTKKPKPIQDEWGFFDPEQCGFAALLAKLDEITHGRDEPDARPPA